MPARREPYALMTKQQLNRLVPGNSQPIRIKMRRTLSEPPREIHAIITLSDGESQPLLGAGRRTTQTPSITDQYHGLVQDVIDRIGHDGTTSRDELNAVGTEMLGKRFCGTFALSEDVPIGRQAPYAILNTDDAPGEHWVAVALSSTGKPVVYDSFGRSELGDHTGDAEQHMVEKNCGQRCLAWLVLAEQRGLRAARKI